MLNVWHRHVKKVHLDVFRGCLFFFINEVKDLDLRSLSFTSIMARHFILMKRWMRELLKGNFLSGKGHVAVCTAFDLD